MKNPKFIDKIIWERVKEKKKKLNSLRPFPVAAPAFDEFDFNEAGISASYYFKCGQEKILPNIRKSPDKKRNKGVLGFYSQSDREKFRPLS